MNPLLSTWSRYLQRPKGGHRSSQILAKGSRKKRRPALRVEWLEDRTVPSTFTVTNTLDSGPGSLRQAILQANAAPNIGGPDTIAFAMDAADPHHVYYRNDGVSGHVSRANVATTTAAADTSIGDIDPDYAHSWWSIQPATALPVITDPVILDGYTQAGSTPNTLGIGPNTPGHANGDGTNAILRIELNGDNLVDHGLTLQGGSSTVRGLVVNQFLNFGILVPIISTDYAGHVVDNPSNTIAGDFVGTDVSGTLAFGNGAGGVDAGLANTFNAGIAVASASGNTVGGLNPADRNLISGNGGEGLTITDSYLVHFYDNVSIHDNVVQGNLIGTDRTGTKPLGNAGDGIGLQNLYSSGLTTPVFIGGISPGSRNIISGNLGTHYLGQNGAAGSGIYTVQTSGVHVEGNFIGTNVRGDAPLGNANGGIFVTFAIHPADFIIGGTAAGEGNVISGNGIGVGISASQHVRVEGNSIYANTNAGIQLGSGSNDDQAAPALTGIAPAGANTTVSGTLASAANTTYRVEFFSSSALDSSGFGQGRTYLGFTLVTTDANGRYSFIATIAAIPTSQPYITATATNLAAGETSAFSQPLARPNRAPVALDGAFTTIGNAPLTGRLSGTDPDQDPLSYLLVSGPARGQVSLSADGSFVYTPDVAYVGTTSFTFRATDGNLQSNTATVTITDNEPAPNVSWTLLSQSVAESVGTVSLTARLTKTVEDVFGADIEVPVTADQAVTIPLTFGGSATPGADYTTPNGQSLTIPAGASTATFTFQVTDDSTPESSETVLVTLGMPTNAVTLPGATTHVVTIQDNDAPKVYFGTSQSSVTEPTASPTNPYVLTNISAYLSSPVDYAIDVPLSFSGTATSLDYEPYSNHLHFAPHTTIATLTLAIGDDKTYEATADNIVIKMGQPQGYAVLGSTTITTVVIQDTNDLKPLPNLSFTTASQTLWEDAGTATVQVHLDQPSAVAVPFTVSVDTNASTATLDSDFQLPKTSFTYPANSTTPVPISVPIINDSTHEGDETISLALATSGAARVSSPARHTITIQDDDPTVMFDWSEYSVPENVGSYAMMVRLSNPTNKTVTIPYSITGSAIKGADYTIATASASPLTIAAGKTSAAINFTIVNDTVVEPKKTINVSLGTLKNAVTGNGPTSQTLTIIDDDQPGVQFSTGSGSVKESGKAVTVTLQLSAAASFDVTASITTTPGDTAVLDKNYKLSKTNVVIPAGQKSATFTITPIDDRIRNADRTAVLNIASVKNGTIGSQNKYKFTIQDDDAPPSVPQVGVVSITTDPQTSFTPPPLGPLDTLSFVAGPAFYPVGTVAISGLDGYIAGGTAFFDANKNMVRDFLDLNGNGVQDSDEPAEPAAMLGNDGLTVLDIPAIFDRSGDGLIDATQGQIVVVGGVDTATGLPLGSALVAPAGTYNPSPLSTLVAALVNGQGHDVTSAYSRVEEALGLPEMDITRLDVLRDAATGVPGALPVFVANAKLADAVSQVSGLISGTGLAPPSSQLGAIVMADLAGKIAAPDSFLDLSLAPVVESVIQGVLSDTGVTLDPQIVSGAASIIAAGNQYIDDASQGDDPGSMTPIARAQTLAQGTVAQQLAAVAAGTSNIDTALTNNTGAALASQIDATPVGDLLPPGIVITDVRQVEGNSGMTYFDFSVALERPSSRTVTVNYATQDGTARVDDGDYQAVSGVLTWAPGDDTAQVIRVPVLGDNVFEAEEAFSVVLTAPTNAVLRKDIGTGVIVNDDGFTYTAPSDSGSNSLTLRVDGNDVALSRGEDTIVQGTLVDSAPFTIIGAAGVDNNLAVELSGVAPTGGRIVFQGGSGTGDNLIVSDATAGSVVHTISGPGAGQMAIDGLGVQYTGAETVVDGMSAAIAGLPSTGLQGSQINLSAVAPADDSPGRFAYQWTVNKNGNPFATGSGTNFSFTPDDGGSYEVRLTTTADGRGVGTEIRPLAVRDVARVALSSSANPSLLYQAVTLAANVTASNPASAAPSGTVTFADTTTGSTLAVVALSGGRASWSWSGLGLGGHTIVATYGGDANYVSGSATLVQRVQYGFSGFLPPVSNGLIFALNRTIPIKFQLSDASGKPISSLGAVTSLQIQALDSNGNPVGAPFNPTATGGTSLSNSGGQYVFNWQTKGLAAGSYQIVLTLADGTTQTKKLQLTASGSAAGLVTGSSGGTATAGALLGGNVAIYVDNANGDLTADELARIQDAVNAVQATIAPYGVTITEVSDPTQADVTLNMDTTSVLGGLAQGVLGCTTDADQVTMVQGWDWYAGGDATQIGGGQYDFETAVMHELGHVLGLGHSSAATSVMYATLASGSTDRTLTTADLNLPDDDSGPCALQAALTTPVSGPSMTPASGLSLPSRSDPLSAVDQLLFSSDLARLLDGMLHAYQAELPSWLAMWQQADSLFVQRLDALLSMGAGSRMRGLSSHALTSDLVSTI